MNIAVADDESIIREQMVNFIQSQNPEYKVAAFASGEELLASAKKFDIIFLDIRMEGRSGLETARELRRRQADTLLIFLTGLKEHVFEAFDVSAFHYLLKPVEEKKISEVLSRAAREVKKSKTGNSERLFIRTRNRRLTIEQNRILYIESRAKKVELHTIDEVIEVYAAMNELEEQLGDSFYRCHRGYLVNMAYIVEYSTDSISLSCGEKVYLSKKKHGEFVKAYMWYLQDGGVSVV